MFHTFPSILMLRVSPVRLKKKTKKNFPFNDRHSRGGNDQPTEYSLSQHDSLSPP